MSDEEYIVRREVEEEEYEQQEQQQEPGPDDPVFDNEFRILILANTKMGSDESTGISVEESDMEEILIRQVRTINDVNEFFDDFDSKIAVPNDGHLKYEVGSDGLCVVLVDSLILKDKVVEFVQKYMESHGDIESTVENGDDGENQDDSERSNKRRK